LSRENNYESWCWRTSYFGISFFLFGIFISTVLFGQCNCFCLNFGVYFVRSFKLKIYLIITTPKKFLFCNLSIDWKKIWFLDFFHICNTPYFRTILKPYTTLYMYSSGKSIATPVKKVPPERLFDLRFQKSFSDAVFFRIGYSYMENLLK
jgi:hypothetical protein